MTNEAPDRFPFSSTTAHARWFRGALVLAVLVRLLVFWIVAQHPERALTPDSPTYLELSRHFAQAYVYGDAEYRAASLLRTPGYPLFGRLWIGLLGDSVTSILIAQNALSLLCVAVVFVLGRRLAGPTAAHWAAVLVAMDPLAITYSNLIRNEVLFTAVLALGALEWHESLARPRAAGAIVTGLLFGLATLVRPVSTYLILFLVPADMWLRRRRAARALMSVWIIAGFLTPVGGWTIRNYQLAGHAVLSPVEDLNLLYYRTAGAIAEERGEQRAAVARRFGPDPEQLPVGFDKTKVMRLLVQHPYGAAVSALRGLGRLLFGPGTAAFNQLLFGNVSEVPLVWSLLSGYVLILYLGVAAGVASLIGQRRKEPLVLLGVIVLYTALISSGPEAYSRFRTPLMPPLAILAGVGFASLGRRVQGLTGSEIDWTQPASDTGAAA